MRTSLHTQLSQPRSALPYLAFLVGVGLWGCGDKEMPAAPANAPNAPNAPKASSDFAASDDGWTVAGDAQARSTKPDYNGTGGNPDGLITAKDNVTGGIFYFVAPPKYHGEAEGAYGRALKYDLSTTSASNPFPAYDVVIVGAGKSIATTLPDDPVPVKTWKSYRVPLDPTGQWKVAAVIDDQEAPGVLPAATEAEIREVLGSVTALKIRGEFNSGADTGSLDNVGFGAL